VERVRRLVRLHFLERTAMMSDTDVDGAVAKGISRASGYGIHDMSDVERYIYLMFALGFDFDGESGPLWAREILRRSGCSAKIRMDLLCAIYDGRLLEGPDDSPIFL
jgi:hypothetical protein